MGFRHDQLLSMAFQTRDRKQIARTKQRQKVDVGRLSSHSGAGIQYPPKGQPIARDEPGVLSSDRLIGADESSRAARLALCKGGMATCYDGEPRVHFALEPRKVTWFQVVS
jgi:hypothetical protein